MTANRANNPDLYERIAGLPLAAEGHRLEILRREVSSRFTRVTTVVTLCGEGQEGVGEDVTYDAGTHEAVRAERAAWDLTGRTTIHHFSVLLERLLPVDEVPYPRWAFEGAALDLALRQAGLTLPVVFRRPFHPVRFVLSTRLESPPSVRQLRDWLAVQPGLEFKLDPRSAWGPEFFLALTAMGRVRVLDLKGAYEGTPVDQPFDPDLYRRVREAALAAPDGPVYIEDPAPTPGAWTVLAGAEDRVSWDAPIHSADDIRRLPFPPGAVNIKPSRFGSWRRLLEAIRYCREAGIHLYGGGQFELGPGRDQIQALASLFYADSANDVAPRVYHSGGPRPGLPPSPLCPAVPALAGFRFRET
ncbi:MAG: hypothetical protein Kow00122_15190 [Thermoleophilia bacterium]